MTPQEQTEAMALAAAIYAAAKGLQPAKAVLVLTHSPEELTAVAEAVWTIAGDEGGGAATIERLRDTLATAAAEQEATQ